MSLYGKEIFIHVGCMLAGKLSKSLHGQRSPGWGEEPKKPVIQFLRPSWRKKRKKILFVVEFIPLVSSFLSEVANSWWWVQKAFFPPFPCYRYREVRLVSELWPPKGVSSQLDFYQRKKKMVKFYIAELYNLFPSFELAWLLSFSWEWGYKFWRKKNPTEVRYATWNWKQNTQWSILSPCLLIFFIYLRTFLGRGAVFALNRVWDELLVL